MSTAREEALNQIVALARAHELTAGDIALALQPSNASQRSRVTLFLAAVGALFVFSGIAIFVRMYWDEMNSPARVVITLGSGLALFVMGLLSIGDERYRRAAPPLLVFAALLETTGLFVLASEYFNLDYDNRHADLFVSGVMLVQQGGTFLVTRRQPFLVLAIAFGGIFFATLLDLLGVLDRWNAVVVGASLLLLARYSDRFPGMTDLWYLVGGCCFLAGLFAVLEGQPFELLYLALTCFMIYVSTVVRSTALMVVGVVATLAYISYYTEEHFVNSIGWPAALILLGLLFIATGLGAVRLRRRYL